MYAFVWVGGSIYLRFEVFKEFLWMANCLQLNHCEGFYKAFHRFGQSKFPDGGLVLGSSQFLILPQLPQKTMLGLKVVKIDSKIRNSLR
jgi:hypothetical protein